MNHRSPNLDCPLARPRICLHEWSGRDKILLLSKFGTKLVQIERITKYI